MTYFQVTTESLGGGYDVRRLIPGEIVEGSSNRMPIRLTILSDRTVSLSLNGSEPMMRREGKGAVILDPTGRIIKSKSVIAYLNLHNSLDLEALQAEAKEDHIAPGAFQDILDGLFRLGREQAGDSKAAAWTVGRLFVQVFTNGLSERYSESND